MIQLHVRAGATVSGAAHGEERRQVRLAAMAAVREGLRGDKGPFTGWMRLRVFSLVCRTLQRLIALRDECRHVTTMHVAHLRRVTLEFGRRAVAAGIVDHQDDVFFLDWDELPRIIFEPHGDWRPIVAERRRRREADAQLEAPNIVGGERDAHSAPAADANGALFGYGVSPGVVTGSVRVLRSVEAIGRLSGEIVVFPAIEPMLTPIFPLVKGIIAEMGGLLSHAAILAREYGVPAVVSVQDATRRLKDGDRVELDGTTGRIRVLEPAGSLSA
jgi:pyruvate,water dikinase